MFSVSVHPGILARTIFFISEVFYFCFVTCYNHVGTLIKTHLKRGLYLGNSFQYQNDLRIGDLNVKRFSNKQFICRAILKFFVLL